MRLPTFACTTLLLLSGAAHATGDAVDDLLAALPGSSVEDVLEALGPEPPIDGLLAPGDGKPLLQLVSLTEVELKSLEVEFRETRGDLYEGKLQLARERAGVLATRGADLLPAGHPLLVDAQHLVEVVDAIEALEPAERDAAVETMLETHRAGNEAASGEGAEPLARRLLESLERVPVTTGAFCRGIGSLAVLRYQAGKPGDAERLAVEAVLRGLDTSGALHPDTCTGLGNLAFFLTAGRRYAEAEAVHAHVLDLRRRLDGTDNLGYATALFNFGQLLRSSRYAEAQATFERVIQLRVAHGDRPVNVGITRAQLGYVLRLQGRYDEAREELEAALTLFDEGLPPEHHERAQALQFLMMVERDTGHYGAATEHGSRAVAMYQELYPGGSPLTAHAMLALASLEERRGQLDEAERLAREAQPIFERFVPANHAYLIEARATLAAVLRAKGDHVRAARALGENLEARISVFGRDSRQVADDLMEIAELALERGALEEARAATERELEILVEVTGEVHPRTADARVRLAQVQLASGAPEAAREELARARAALGRADSEDTGTQRVTRAHADWVSGRVLVALDAPSQALDLYLDAYAGLLRVDPTHPLLVDVALDLGELRYDLGDAAGAASAFEEALVIAEALRVRVLGDELDRATYAGRLSLDRASRALVRARAQDGDPVGALDAAERGRGRALLDLLARSGSDLISAAGAADPAPTAALAARLEAERDARGELVVAEEAIRKRRARATPEDAPGTDEVSALLEEVEARRRALREASAAVARELSALYPRAQARTGRAVLEALGEGEELLHYTFGDRSAVLVTTIGGAPLQAHAIAEGADAASRLRTEVLEITARLRAGDDVPDARLAALAGQLLPGDLQEELTWAKRVVIVPDGPLHEFPFEVLPLAEVSWLDAGPPTAYAPSGSLMVHTRAVAARRSTGRDDAAARSALVLGAPTFAGALTARDADSGRALAEIDTVRLFGDRLRPLPGTAAEATRVAAQLSSAGFDVTQRLGAEASEGALRAQTGASVLHIATHGFRAPSERPYEAAVALRTPARPSVEDDGFLTLDELVRDWGDVLVHCELVTLSACDTNVGTTLGDSVVSLSWGFFHAGAESVLVSLWKVDDLATLLFMDEFYAAWTGGAAKTDALAAARRALARRSPEDSRRRLVELGVVDGDSGDRSAQDGFPRPGADPRAREANARFDFRKPRYWAAFQLTGTPE